MAALGNATTATTFVAGSAGTGTAIRATQRGAFPLVTDVTERAIAARSAALPAGTGFVVAEKRRANGFLTGHRQTRGAVVHAHGLVLHAGAIRAHLARAARDRWIGTRG